MKTIIFNGRSFTLCEGKKYHYNTKLRKTLHQAIWEHHNGELPKGYHIHHIDHDALNNDLSNLKLMSAEEHLKYHASLRDKEVLRENMHKAMLKAKEWHKSEEGREWHRKHYEKMKDKFHIEVELICLHCGVKYKTTKKDSKFCSNKCKSAFRRKNGLDDVVKKCERCGKEFKSNKYSKTKFCSKSCSRKNYWENLKDSPNLQE